MTTWMLIFGFLTLLSAVGVVTFKNPLHSALSLIMTLLFVAAHYALLGADFLAAIQVMVYAGAIMVLVVFVIMLLGDGDENQPSQIENVGIFSWLMAGVSGVTILSILAYSILNSPSQTASLIIPDGSAKSLGLALYTQYIFPFEITSLLILSAIIGAVMLGAERRHELKPGRGLKASREKHSKEKIAS